MPREGQQTKDFCPRRWETIAHPGPGEASSSGLRSLRRADPAQAALAVTREEGRLVSNTFQCPQQ